MICRWFHRWTRWAIEYEEMPDGEAGVWAFHTRRCKRAGCRMVEEVSVCASSSPEVLLGLIH
ncbi:hypothetical protein [Streptomyces sp. NPDC010273]|uniref:hypothetical protein n=1 Tax=Streptomyces sp. NPDC010273 TaxID=3364829 RepID=UPI0036E4289B